MCFGLLFISGVRVGDPGGRFKLFIVGWSERCVFMEFHRCVCCHFSHACYYLITDFLYAPGRSLSGDCSRKRFLASFFRRFRFWEMNIPKNWLNLFICPFILCFTAYLLIFGSSVDGDFDCICS